MTRNKKETVFVPICTFADGTKMYFKTGYIDDFCVTLDDPSHARDGVSPTDKKYFTFMKKKSRLYGADRLYQDFVKVYNRTGKTVSQDTLEYIHQMSRTYNLVPGHSLRMEQLFSILYAGMIAEENRQDTRLGKRIKRLGVHLLLKEDFSPQVAADYMRGMGWKEIAAICEEKGF